MTDWKELSKLMTEMHNDYGRSAVMVSGENAFANALENETALQDITTEDIETSWETQKVTPKQIRRWIWGIRHNDKMKEPSTVIWTGWDEANQTSWGGLAQLVEESNDETIKVEINDG